jgi:hypothetical protein
MILDEVMSMTLDQIILGSLPGVENVRYGVDRGDGTSGACRVPAAGDVRRGVAVDVADTGTLEPSGLLRLSTR